VHRGAGGPQAQQRRDAERDQDGQLEEPQVVLVELVRIEMTEVAPERLQRRDEGRARVAAAVGEQRDAAGGRLHDHLPGGEGHGRHHPGQVVAAGAHPAPQHAHDAHDGQGGHRDHDRLPGQRAVGEQDRGQHRAAGPHRQQPGQQAGGGERFRGVPGQAGDDAEVAGQQQPGQRGPAALDGEHAAEVAHGADGGDVDGDEHHRHQGVLAGRGQPGQGRIPDPHVPVGPVHRDAVSRAGEVERVEREPVEELPVVAVGRRYRYAVRQLSRRREMTPDQDELADVALGPGLQAGQREGERRAERDQAGDGGPVQPRRRPGGRRLAVVMGSAIRGASERGQFRAVRHDRPRDPRAGRRLLRTRHGASSRKGGQASSPPDLIAARAYLNWRPFTAKGR
jgi:hypothetical protein